MTGYERMFFFLNCFSSTLLVVILSYVKYTYKICILLIVSRHVYPGGERRGNRLPLGVQNVEKIYKIKYDFFFAKIDFKVAEVR